MDLDYYTIWLGIFNWVSDLLGHYSSVSDTPIFRYLGISVLLGFEPTWNTC
jgi:hypothetical protein